ncbi:hypothetical protein AMECASPLE_034948 [Ameca splendens]|uniref:Uncharacterized protein n=1 Tax=Ameca splendens TaxID=208324 RepID=A0ABV0ZG14_9TELE
MKTGFVFKSLFKGIQRLKTLSLSKSEKQSNKQKSQTVFIPKMRVFSQLQRVLEIWPLDPPRVRLNKVIYEGTHLPSLEIYTSGSVNHKTLQHLNLESICSK